MKLTLVCEHNEGMDNEEAVAAYPEKMEHYLADFFRQNGHDVTLIVLDKEADCSALTEEILVQTEVLIWWGHWYHGNVRDDVAMKVVNYVNRGMGFLALHSGHHSKPFRYLMGTSCNLSWREENERERVWVIDETHPIAKGLDKYFVIPHEEMYGEQFDIPTPDELVFLSWFAGGEVMRSGCLWKRGRGKVFFFRPGHETNPTYRQKEVQTVLLNAIAYLKPQEVVASLSCPHVILSPQKSDVVAE